MPGPPACEREDKRLSTEFDEGLYGRIDATSVPSFFASFKQSDTVVCTSFADLKTLALLRS
jgi:hypothetical protein